MPPPVVKTVINNMNMNVRSASESQLPKVLESPELTPTWKCFPVVRRFPTKCTNCCCKLVMALKRKDAERDAHPGLVAIRVPGYSKSESEEVPMSIILSTVLNLPKDNAYISNVLFCRRCARILAQIFELNRALENFSQPESELNFMQNKIRGILNKFFAPVGRRNDVETNRSFAAKSSTNLGARVSTTSKKAPSVPTVTPPEAEKTSSFSDVVVKDEPKDFDSESEAVEMEITPDLNCFSPPPPEVPPDEPPVAEHTNERIDPVVPSAPKVTEHPEILTASKLVQRLKAGNSGQLFPPPNSTKPTTPQCGSGILKSLEMVKPNRRQGSPAITVVPGLINVRAQLAKSANVNPDAASHGTSRRKQVLKPFEQATNTVESMIVDEINREEDTTISILTAIEAVIKKKIDLSVMKTDLAYYQTIAKRRYKANCSRCAHVFSNVSLLDIEKHFDEEHGGIHESSCNFGEAQLPDACKCVMLRCKAHFMRYVIQVQKYFKSICGLNLKLYTPPPLGESGQPTESEQLRITVKMKERNKERYRRAKAIALTRRATVPPFNHGTCPYCGKSYVNRMRNWMEMHIKLHHRHQSRYCCDICGKPCPSSAFMQAHKLSHLNVTERLKVEAEQGIQKKEFLCSDCGLVLASEYNLRAHQRKVHGDQEARRIVCQEPGCEYSCLDKKTLTRHHAQFHDPNGELRYYCKQCNKGFRVHADLKEHEMLECDFWNRPFVCDQDSCPKRFKTKQALVLHLHDVHKLSPEEARARVYPGLDCPAWVGRKYKSSKSSSATSSRRRRQF